MTFVSKFEQDWIERRAAARRAQEGVTPQHTAASASLDDGEHDDDSEHQAEADTAKAYRDAYEPPADYPTPIAVHPEHFRKGPIREGHDALSPGYEPPLSFLLAPPPGPSRAEGWSLGTPPAPGPYADGDCP